MSRHRGEASRLRLASSVRVEMRAEIFFWDETGRLPKDCPAGTDIQLGMGGNR